MRVAPLVKAAAIAIACWVGVGCAQPPRPTPTPTPSPTPTPAASDLTIDINLSPDEKKKKCVVRFDVPAAKEAARAVAYTGYQVIWRVTSNRCGDKKKGGGKALGLKSLKGKKDQMDWLDRCTTLPFVPAVFDKPPQIVCFIPWKADGDIVGEYEYFVDGDDVDPLDPGLDVRPGR